MELSPVADDLNGVSVLVNVAHRLLLTIRDERHPLSRSNRRSMSFGCRRSAALRAEGTGRRAP